MEKVKLEITGVFNSQTTSGAYTLILSEDMGRRKMPIIIGAFEAQSIIIELKNIKEKKFRPFPHDLFNNLAILHDINIIEVVVDKFDNGIFHAKIVCNQNGKISNIDSRTSDAIAIAIRAKCPIYTFETIISEAGIVLENEDNNTTKRQEKTEIQAKPKNTLSNVSKSELESKLEQAINEENYELASKIRDEIQKRKS